MQLFRTTRSRRRVRQHVSSRLPLDDNSVFRKPCNRARRSRYLENVKSSVGAINNIDISPLIGFDIVALYRDLADILPIDLDTTLVSCRRNRRYKVANFFRMIRVADIDRANSCIEPSYKGEFSKENRRHAFIG